VLPEGHDGPCDGRSPEARSAAQDREHRLNQQQRSWLLKMPAWTAVSGEDILRRIDGLVTDNALLRAENERLREQLGSLEDTGAP
jgi:hypothetical protein